MNGFVSEYSEWVMNRVMASANAHVLFFKL